MNLTRRFFTISFMTLGLLLVTSCEDWSSGSQENFSSVSGELGDILEGLTVTGSYRGTLPGGYAVAGNTYSHNETNYSSLSITQSGETSLTVSNKTGSDFQGSIGEPLVSEDLNTSTDFEDGQVLATYSASWSGASTVIINGVITSGGFVDFSGVIELVYSDSGKTNTKLVVSGSWVETSYWGILTRQVQAEAQGPDLTLNTANDN